MKKRLFIGIGNPLRGDDGAGRIAATRAAEIDPDADVLVLHQLTPDIAPTLSQYETVVFFDADISAYEVMVKPLDPVLPSEFPTTHHVNPSMLIALCAALYPPVPRSCLLVSLPARNFNFTEELSAEAMTGVISAVTQLRELLHLQP